MASLMLFILDGCYLISLHFDLINTRLYLVFMFLFISFFDFKFMISDS